MIVDQRRSKTQVPKHQTRASSASQKRSGKSVFQSQNDEHGSQDTQSDDDADDSNDDDEDVVDANEHSSHENDDRDEAENENNSGSEDVQYPQSFLTRVQDFTSKATLAQATKKVASLRNQLQQLASVEEQRDLKPEEEEQRWRFNYELRLCKARCDELKRPVSADQETEEEGPASDEEQDEEASGQEPDEQEPDEEEATAKTPSVPAKTARKKRTSKKRDTSPAWVHDSEKWWPIHGIMQEHDKGRWYLIRWQGTDKHGNAWQDTWVRRKNVTPEALDEWTAQKKEKKRLKRAQAAEEVRKKNGVKGKTSKKNGDGDGDDDDRIGGDFHEEEDE